MRRIAFFVTFSIGMLFFHSRCDNTQASGNSTETTNGISLSAKAGFITGITRPGVFIGVYAEDYNPYRNSGFADTVFSDDEGGFAFSGMPEGHYNLLFRDTLSHENYLERSLSVLAHEVTIARDNVYLPPGRITGSLSEKDELIDYIELYHILYISGTPFQARIASDGKFLLENVPAGNYTISLAGETNVIMYIASVIPKNYKIPEINIEVYPDSTVNW